TFSVLHCCLHGCFFCFFFGRSYLCLRCLCSFPTRRSSDLHIMRVLYINYLTRFLFLSMEKMQKDLPDSQVATQRNDLLHGQQSLSLVQKRIFALTIQQIKRDDDELKTYTIEFQYLVDAGTSRRIFSLIEKETDSLLRKILLQKEHIEGRVFPETSRWSLVINAKHRPGEGNLEIRLHPDIREMLLDLKEQGNFTPVPVAELLACRSTYGQRMYELLYSWRRTGRWETT